MRVALIFAGCLVLQGGHAFFTGNKDKRRQSLDQKRKCARGAYIGIVEDNVDMIKQSLAIVQREVTSQQKIVERSFAVNEAWQPYFSITIKVKPVPYSVGYIVYETLIRLKNKEAIDAFQSDLLAAGANKDLAKSLENARENFYEKIRSYARRASAPT